MAKQAGKRRIASPRGVAVHADDDCLRPPVDEVPEPLLAAIVDYFDPVRVILFGSRARGEATVDSDYDLLVIDDDDVPAERLRWHAAYEARKGHSVAVDIVRCRHSVYEDKRDVIGSLVHTADEEGSVVYERG